MNIKKNFRPNLIDPILEKRIIKTLNPPKPDYWAPTKNVANGFYQTYVKQNFGLIIFVVIIILFLIYRYRIIKKNREYNDWQKYYGYNVSTEKIDPPKKNIEYSKIAIEAYNMQKEMMREPPISTMGNLAYPMYPYTKGGTLTPKRNKI